jgi:hypothetical protein
MVEVNDAGIRCCSSCVLNHPCFVALILITVVVQRKNIDTLTVCVVTVVLPSLETQRRDANTRHQSGQPAVTSDWQDSPIPGNCCSFCHKKQQMIASSNGCLPLIQCGTNSIAFAVTWERRLRPGIGGVSRLMPQQQQHNTSSCFFFPSRYAARDPGG